MSSMVPDDAPRPRFCNIKKWEGFTGYGFNLHAEKGKSGQYIGKVDPDSPADLAGLKEGDRIIEVNGTNISNENHQQVVQRIKAVSDSTKLLVTDKEAEEYYKEMKIVVRGDMSNVLSGESPDSNPAHGADNNVEVLNNVDRTSTHSSHHSDAGETGHPFSIRLCRIRLRPDFQGYGFNLHAEKNKVGQYIGKVDDDSPALDAGVREKDRILEVNGESVVNENHQGAVLKIKSNPAETSLLVVDPEADEYFKDKGITLGGHVSFIKHLDSGAGRSEVVTAGSEQAEHAYKPRLIQLETWPDFNGYGFNMHSIKGRKGEYIGKVEHGSPSHVCGLKEGDRVLEVCGSSVEDDTHNDVVGKIKASGGRALLLVVDADADKYYRERGIAVTAHLPNVTRIDCPDRKPEANGTADSDHEYEENQNEANEEEYETETRVEHEEVPNGLTNHNEYEDVVKREPEMRAVEPTPEPVRPTTPESPKSPVTVAGIEFAASASEARRRMASKKRDSRMSANLSAKEKYDLFQRL